MKNKLIRLLALVFVVIFALSSLVACGDDSDDDNNVNKVVGSGEDRFKDVNFGGKTIRLLMSSCTDATRGGVSPSKYMVGPDGDTNDKIEQEVQKRNDYVKGKLGLDVEYSYIDDAWNTAAPLIRQIYQANEKDMPDGVSNRIYALFELQLEGIFRNVNTTKYTNYFDFTDKTWYVNSMNSYAFGNNIANGGKGYMLFGDYFLDLIRCMSVMYVNEEQLIAKTSYQNIEDFYSDIADYGDWTWDKFLGIINQSYNDTPNSVQGTDAEDELGAVFMANKSGALQAGMCMTLAYGTSINLIEYNSSSGAYEYNSTAITGTFDTYLKKIKDIFNKDGVLLYKSATESTNDIRNIFAKGKTVFSGNLYIFDLEGSILSGLKKCPIPYPKLYETDRYVARVHDNANAGAIFKSTRNFTEVSAFWQYANIKSEAVRNKYYNDGLKLKYETGTGTKKMLDLLYNSLTINATQQFDQFITVTGEDVSTSLFTLLGGVVYGNKETASSWEGMKNQKVNGLKALNDKYKALKDE